MVTNPEGKVTAMKYMGIEITEYRITIRREGEERQVMTFPATGFGKVAYEAAVNALCRDTSAYLSTEAICVGTGVMEATFH